MVDFTVVTSKQTKAMAKEIFAFLKHENN